MCEDYSLGGTVYGFPFNEELKSRIQTARKKHNIEYREGSDTGDCIKCT